MRLGGGGQTAWSERERETERLRETKSKSQDKVNTKLYYKIVWSHTLHKKIQEGMLIAFFLLSQKYLYKQGPTRLKILHHLSVQPKYPRV